MTSIHYMTLSLSNYVNRAAMMREVGGFLVTHFADLQSFVAVRYAYFGKKILILKFDLNLT